MITKRVLALLWACTLATVGVSLASPSAAAADPGPTPVAPRNGDSVDRTRDMTFQVGPVSGASGYLWGFFQNGQMVWENNRDEGTLSSATYVIKAGSRGASALTAGPVDVWIRALLQGQWTEATVLALTLTSGKIGTSAKADPVPSQLTTKRLRR
jgi:hypothetical protein